MKRQQKKRNKNLTVSKEVIKNTNNLIKTENPFVVYGYFKDLLYDLQTENALYVLYQLTLKTDIKNNAMRNKEIFDYFVNLAHIFSSVHDSYSIALNCYKYAIFVSKQLTTQISDSYQRDLVKAYDDAAKLCKDNDELSLAVDFQKSALMIIQDISDKEFFSRVNAINSLCKYLVNNQQWDEHQRITNTFQQIISHYEKLIKMYPYNKYKRLYQYSEIRENVIVAFYMWKDEIQNKQ